MKVTKAQRARRRGLKEAKRRHNAAERATMKGKQYCEYKQYLSERLRAAQLGAIGISAPQLEDLMQFRHFGNKDAIAAIPLVHA